MSEDLAILVLGGHGMLGQAVIDAVIARGGKAFSRGRAELDLIDTPAIALEITALLPEGLNAAINCAAFTAVDDCEVRVEEAMEVNGHAVGRLAQVCERHALPLVHVSSDYVFRGNGIKDDAGDLRPYREGDPVGPVSVYGQSKELGERLALAAGASVVRASWLFGPGGPNFVDTMLRVARGGKPLKVVDDQVGCPTYTPDLAEALVDVASARIRSGGSPSRGERLFHFANAPAVSWFAFAKQIFSSFDQSAEVAACTTEEFPRPAPRPAYSVLDTTRFRSQFNREPRSWKQCLTDYRSIISSVGPIVPEGEG